MRPVPYKSPELAEAQDLVSAIRARRGGVLLNLDLMLLHSVPLADGWKQIGSNVAAVAQPM